MAVLTPIRPARCSIAGSASPALGVQVETCSLKRAGSEMLFEIEMRARCRGTAPSSSSAEDTTAEGAVTGEAAVAAAADTAGTASAASFEPGHRVQLMGLEDRPDLNDQTGVVVLIRPDKRLTVIVDNGEIIAVRPVKLALVPGASKVAVLT